MKRPVKPIHSEPGLTIGIDSAKLWIYVNERKWGFKTTEGIYCHRRRVEMFRKELGFHIPKVLLGYRITFEIKMTEECYSTWTYDPKFRQRMLPTTPMIFVSAARMAWKKDAPHLARPR